MFYCFITAQFQGWRSKTEIPIVPIHWAQLFAELFFDPKNINLTIGDKLNSHTVVCVRLSYCLFLGMSQRLLRRFFCPRQTIRAHPPRDNWFRRGGDVGAPRKVLSRGGVPSATTPGDVCCAARQTCSKNCLPRRLSLVCAVAELSLSLAHSSDTQCPWIKIINNTSARRKKLEPLYLLCVCVCLLENKLSIVTLAAL